MRRKGFASSNNELKLHPYSWQETLLRTDYKDTGARRAVSNHGDQLDRQLWTDRTQLLGHNGFSNAVVNAAAIAM